MNTHPATRAILLCILVLSTALHAHALPAFPGAEGFGSETPGGRAGAIIAVTNLNDDGPGSLREAVTTPGPRVVVFRVGGTIALSRRLSVTEPYCTIAGQTAPGDGILLRDAGLFIETHNVIVRCVRVRIGTGLNEPYDRQDPLHIEGEQCHNIIVDHCSFSWSQDENIGISSGAHDVTFQWNIVAEPLEQPHPPEVTDGEIRTHAFNMILGNYPDRLSVHHNYLAHADQRNPRIQGGLIDFSNNLVYNWDATTGVFSRDPYVNFIKNHYVMGPSSGVLKPIEGRNDQLGLVYVEGNIAPTRPTDDLPEWSLTTNASTAFQALVPHEVAPVTLVNAFQSTDAILQHAGARYPALDSVDIRVLGDYSARTGRIIDRPSDVGGFPTIASGTPPEDSDGDAIPDFWELEHNLATDDPSDATQDRDGDGYTNIEEYINGLIEMPYLGPTPTITPGGPTLAPTATFTPTNTPRPTVGIVNGSFEDALGDDWSMWVGAGGNSDGLERDVLWIGAYDGAQALAVKGFGSGGKGAYQYVPSGWTEGLEYQLSVQCKNLINSGMVYGIGYAFGNRGEAGGASATYGPLIEHPDDWTEATVSFTYSGSSGVTIYLKAVYDGHTERAGFDAVNAFILTDPVSTATATPSNAPVPTATATPTNTPALKPHMMVH